MRLTEKVSRNIGVLRRELAGKRPRSLVESVVEQAGLFHQNDQRARMIFWLDRLAQKINEAMSDETDAMKMYDTLSTEIAAMFPPGTPPYDTVVSIEKEEAEHYRKLSDVRQIILTRRKELGGE